MKAGIVQGLFALAATGAPDGAALLLTGDEEIGSLTSRPLIEDSARGARAALVLEPGRRRVKVARKGSSVYHVRSRGRASHAGLEPEGGERARRAGALRCSRWTRSPNGGTTVTPAVAAGNHDEHRPRGRAILRRRAGVDGRPSRTASTPGCRRSPQSCRVSLEVTGDATVRRSSAARGRLVRTRAGAAAPLGVDDLEGIDVGGGSDGKFTAALGMPTLDGLGAVGAGAHAEGEHVVVGRMSERAALVAALVTELTGAALACCSGRVNGGH